MPIKELRCPECGDEVTIGLPRGGTVKSITTEATPEPTTDQKLRPVACENHHEVFVLFEV